MRWRRRPGCWPCSACCRRARLVRRRARRRASASPTGPSARTSSGCAGSATRSTRCAGRAGATASATTDQLPPLLLEDDEAVAVAVGLGAAPAVPGIEETERPRAGQARARAARRLRRRVNALHASTDVGPSQHRHQRRGPGRSTRRCSPRWPPPIRDHEELRVRLPADADGAARRGRALPAGELAASAGTSSPATPRDRHAGQAVPLDWMRAADPRRPAGSPRAAATAGTTRRSCCARSRSRAGRCTPGSPWTRRPRRCCPGSTRPSAWSRRVDDDHCVLVTGARQRRDRSRCTSACSASTSTSTEPPELVEHVATLATRYAGALPRGLSVSRAGRARWRRGTRPRRSRG